MTPPAASSPAWRRLRLQVVEHSPHLVVGQPSDPSDAGGSASPRLSAGTRRARSAPDAAQAPEAGWRRFGCSAPAAQHGQQEARRAHEHHERSDYDERRRLVHGPPGAGVRRTGRPVKHVLVDSLKFGPQLGALELEDQVGRRTVGFHGAQWLCALANVTGVAVTTTTTIPGSECRFTNGQCLGTCSDGGKRGVAASGASCECRAVSCGDADAPQCEGFSTTAGEACIFNLTGCSCVRIP